MPRLSNALISRAYGISPLLPLVLRGSRELPSAINELRWLREHVRSENRSRDTRLLNQKLLGLCRRRANGEPLQYLLGTQPFGELEIKCRPGVLIPRPETEAYTTHLAEALLSQHGNGPLEPKANQNSLESLNVVDFCTGTGCIALLTGSLLSERFPRVNVVGVDISPHALALANENLAHNLKDLNPNKASPRISFEAGNLFSDLKHPSFHSLSPDVVISNPPYISEKGFNTETTRSVRTWEPKLALVPAITPERLGCAPEDIFYQELLKTYSTQKSRMMLLEIGDSDQAMRVAKLAVKIGGDCKVQIWRDWPDQEAPPEAPSVVRIEVQDGSKGSLIRRDILVKGLGKARSVLVLWGSYIDLLHPPHADGTDPPESLDWETTWETD
ncbi:hypothetical protein BP6252_01141 [Coleophoma cylindrospora]|uniref:peptide chain release factor N(5)-glutamine methyltransferase n=1 Tax=Coleophoma cylindrospora TaxID=1849047 RepID=A0A3D8SS15_9HELO|nr:hypothetical protein BP6252_01141 [Coleophoma cylindrospora]